jgi:hypothetical protein
MIITTNLVLLAILFDFCANGSNHNTLMLDDEFQTHLLDLRSVANETAEIISVVIVDTNKSLKKVAKFKYLRTTGTN